MDVYQIVYNKDSDPGVFAMGCVADPAMQDIWLTLAEHPRTMQFEAVDEEQRLLLGAAIIPDKKIFRRQGDYEFYVVFNKETIKDLAHDFIRKGMQSNTTDNHEFSVEGCSVVETWIVKDPDNDKSRSFNRQYEEGTWVIMMKVDNDEVWKKVKNGERTGFSIEAGFGLDKVDFKNQLKMEKDTNKEKKGLDKIITDAFSGFLKNSGITSVEMAELKLRDGAKIRFEGEKLEVGTPVFGVSKDGKEEFRMPKGKFETETGETFHVDENGIVEQPPAETASSEIDEKIEEVVEEMSKQFSETLSKVVTKFGKDMEQMRSEFKLKLASEQKKNEELESKLEKVPAEPKIIEKENKFNQDSKVSVPETSAGKLFDFLNTIPNAN